MRRALAVLLLVTAALAGCLEDPGEVVDPAERDEPDDARDGPRGNGTSQDGERNGTDEGGGNETDDPDEGGGNETDEGDGNETGEADPGWPDPEEAAVRPGVRVAGVCTANYVFSSPDNRTLYVGTAAHCFEDPQPGDRVSIADGAASGTLAYHSRVAMDRANESSQAARAFNDFALVRVDPSHRDEVHPATLHYGGPAGTTGSASFGDRVLTYGSSGARGFSDEVDPREGYITGSSDWHVDAYLSSPGVPGDSGSPLLTSDGEALGVLITVEVLPVPGSNDAVKLEPVLDYMEAHGGPPVELKGWPLLDDGRLPG